MTQPGRDPEHDAVRRLLAEARHDGPIPDDVRARLDDVLAGLTAERREVRPTRTVVDLSARRRQRRRTALLAAAAVVVAGVGLGQVLDNTGGPDHSSAGDAASSPERSIASKERAESGPGKSEDRSATSDSSSLGAQAEPGLPPVRSTHLEDDLRRLRPAAAAARETVPDAYAAHPCAAPIIGRGAHVPVALDGEPAVAVFRPASGGRQRVEVYGCDSGAEIHSVRLRLR